MHPFFAIVFWLSCSSSFSRLALTSATILDGSIMEATFPSGSSDFSLQGTLRLPSFSTYPRPWPGVVLIHGSGPQSRDEVATFANFGITIPVFQEIAEGLVENGIAVLTYDKRTCGTFNGCSSNQYPLPDQDLTVDDFINDAVAATEFLASRPQIRNVVVIGHSQAGQYIPILLDRMPEIAVSGVLLAAPYQPIDKILKDQLAFSIETLLALGFNQSEAEAQVEPVVELVEGVQAIRNGTNSDEAVGGTGVGFWKSWFDVVPHSLSAAAIVEQPMLVLNGLMDSNVPVEEAEAWAAHLTSVDANFELQLLPCVSHAMNCLNATNLVNLTAGDVGLHVDPIVVETLADFVRETTREKMSFSASPTESPSASSKIATIGNPLAWAVVAMAVSELLNYL